MTDKKKALAEVKTLLSGLSEEQATTITKHGLNKEQYSAAMVEAVIANPDVLNCNRTSLALAFRKCCRDGLLPDGREAAIIPVRAKGGGFNAKYLPMKEGLCKQIHRATKGVIRSGIVRDGWDYTIKESSNGEGVIEVYRKFGPSSEDAQIIGAWASYTLPDGASYVQFFDQGRLAHAREMSSADKTWQLNEEAMSEKAVVKSLMHKVRFLLPDDFKTELDADDEYPDFNQKDAVIIEAEPVEEVDIEVQDEEVVIEDVEDDGLGLDE